MKEEELKLLRGAVQDKHLIIALRHIRLYRSRAQATNLGFTTDVPFEFNGVDVTVPAAQFISAMSLCDAPDVTVTAANRLLIKQGSFKASLPLLENTTFPLSAPDGEKYEVGEGLLEAFTIARRFTGDLKPWTKGVTMRDGKLWATNGLSLVRIEVDIDKSLDINIPEDTVSELVRIGMPITAMRVSESSCTFKLGDASWLRTSLVSATSPDMSKLVSDCNVNVNSELVEAVSKLTPFFDSARAWVKFDEIGVHAVGDTEASIAVTGLHKGTFNANLLKDVLALAKYIDFTKYPGACPYSDGERIRGAIVGVRT
jgi:hypothetical protein